jgi:hypothetical protein
MSRYTYMLNSCKGLFSPEPTSVLDSRRFQSACGKTYRNYCRNTYIQSYSTHDTLRLYSMWNQLTYKTALVQIEQVLMNLCTKAFVQWNDRNTSTKEADKVCHMPKSLYRQCQSIMNNHWMLSCPVILDQYTIADFSWVREKSDKCVPWPVKSCC